MLGKAKTESEMLSLVVCTACDKKKKEKETSDQLKKMVLFNGEKNKALEQRLKNVKIRGPD